MKKYKMIQVGTGGFGERWCSDFLPVNIKDGLIKVVAAVDNNPSALKNAQQYLGLNSSQCYTDIKKAFDENKADFCTVVVPPVFHEKVVDIALAHDMHILSEKPISNTLESSIRIASKVKKVGKKMGVTMTHRFDQDKTTLRELLRSGKVGKLDYIIFRYTMNLRKFGSWGQYRHEIKDALIIEGGVHHLDILNDLSGAKCETVYAKTWNPDWGEYKGDSQGLVIMDMENGVKAFYEGANSNAKSLNGWKEEYFRVECEKATIILEHRKIEILVEGKPAEIIENLEQPKWGNAWLIEKFVHWLGGGEQMETNVEDNLQSVALVFSVIESSRTGMPVYVQKFLEEVKKKSLCR
jgi:predicted dehydrogenase